MHREQEAVITHLESKVVSPLQYLNMSQLKNVEMVRQIVESKEKNDEDTK